MDKYILIDISLFTLNQKIFIQDKDNVEIKTCTLEEIPDLSIQLCKDCQINTIKIIGSYDYGIRISKEIKENEKLLYAENKINVEVI